MHIFENGPHGVGLALGDPALSAWPVLLTNWLRGRGLLTNPRNRLITSTPDCPTSNCQAKPFEQWGWKPSRELVGAGFTPLVKQLLWEVGQIASWPSCRLIHYPPPATA